MDRNKILERVQEICRDVFDNEELIITEQTVASDVDGWDSLNHLSLINEIELSFEIKMTMGEIQNLKNVGELVNAIMAHSEA